MRKTPLKRKTPLRAKKPLRGSKLRSKKKKPKKPTITLLKKKLWEECKRITRARHGYDCYTCGQRSDHPHTGHFIPSSICSAEMRYDLMNLRPQCFRCNIHLSGNWVAYEKHLKADGIDVEVLKQRNEDTKGGQYDRLWYENKIEEYKKL